MKTEREYSQELQIVNSDHEKKRLMKDDQIRNLEDQLKESQEEIQKSLLEQKHLEEKHSKFDQLD